MSSTRQFVIEDGTDNDVLFPRQFGRGFDPDSIARDRVGFGAPPADMRLIPRSEWDARIDEQEAQKSSLWHLAERAGHKVLDQNGQGYCWAYSTTASVMFARMQAGAPSVRLSGHSVGCKVKGFRDEGGWCGLSAEFVRKSGVVPVSKWPEKSMGRANDTPEAWAAGAGFRITSDWVDLSRPVYDQNLTFDMIASQLLQNNPCPVDFEWWGHSVCAVQLVRVEAGSYGLKIANSWTPQWGDNGYGVLRGDKAQPMGAVCTRGATAA